MGLDRAYDVFSDDFVDVDGDIPNEITEQIADPDRWDVSARKFLSLDLDVQHRNMEHEQYNFILLTTFRGLHV